MVGPILILTLSMTTVFFNILPDPGQVYPVPCVKDIDVTLRHRRVTRHVTMMARNVTIRINYIICSKPYLYFYKFIRVLYLIITKIKGDPVKRTGVSITKPEVFKIDFDKVKDDN